MLKPSLIAKTNAKANESQIKIINNVRITYLTSRLIRVEVDKFYDDASFTVFNRKFENVEKFKITKSGNKIFVETKDAVFTIKNNKPLCVKIKSSDKVQYFKKQKNLKGTRRTLDATFGKVELNDGLITKDGAYLLDDSNSSLLDESGHFVPRDGGKDYSLYRGRARHRALRRAFRPAADVSRRSPEPARAARRMARSCRGYFPPCDLSRISQALLDDPGYEARVDVSRCGA